jgi:hypothetical protein
LAQPILQVKDMPKSAMKVSVPLLNDFRCYKAAHRNLKHLLNRRKPQKQTRSSLPMSKDFSATCAADSSRTSKRFSGTIESLSFIRCVLSFLAGQKLKAKQTNLQKPAMKEAALRKKALQGGATPSKKPSDASTSTPTKVGKVTMSNTPLKQVATSAKASPTPGKAFPSSTSGPQLTQGGVTFPAQIFDSMPNAPEGDEQRYFLLSCGGQDCQTWYAAVFDRTKTLIGHAAGDSKGRVCDIAEAMCETKTVSFSSQGS